MIKLKYMLEVLIDVSLTCILTDSRHSYGYQLCSSSQRLVP